MYFMYSFYERMMCVATLLPEKKEIPIFGVYDQNGFQMYLTLRQVCTNIRNKNTVG